MEWLKDGQVRVEQKIESNEIVFLHVLRRRSLGVITRVEANLQTAYGTDLVSLRSYF